MVAIDETYNIGRGFAVAFVVDLFFNDVAKTHFPEFNTFFA